MRRCLQTPKSSHRSSKVLAKKKLRKHCNVFEEVRFVAAYAANEISRGESPNNYAANYRLAGAIPFVTTVVSTYMSASWLGTKFVLLQGVQRERR